MDLIIRGGKTRLLGELKVPGDKSISHRAVILGSLANGTTSIENISIAEDTSRTIKCFKDMGVGIKEDGNKIIIKGVGLKGLIEPKHVLNCGNSGTTMRLLSGIMVGQRFTTRLIGDESLTRRPMDRIITPLGKMGACIHGIEGKYPPLDISPIDSSLMGITYEMPVASAQVKSAILLATLYGKGKTKIIEKKTTRDHTEKMLEYFGTNIDYKDGIIYMDSLGTLEGKDIYIPGDISSAAYFMVAGLLIESSHIMIRDVNINPTRTGIIDVLKAMGGNIKIRNKRIKNNELLGDIKVKESTLEGIKIDGDIVGTLIDEIPIIAVAAAFSNGSTVIRDVKELRYKECDRIQGICKGLKAMGAEVEELADGMIIQGKNSLRPAYIDSCKDHRIAMAFSIAALKINGHSRIKDYRSINISYPGFYKTLFKLCQ